MVQNDRPQAVVVVLDQPTDRQKESQRRGILGRNVRFVSVHMAV